MEEKEYVKIKEDEIKCNVAAGDKPKARKSPRNVKCAKCLKYYRCEDMYRKDYSYSYERCEGFYPSITTCNDCHISLVKYHQLMSRPDDRFH